jgi:hypothetical protein
MIEGLCRVRREDTSAHHQTAKTGDTEYRVGYYIIGRNGRAEGKWTWGQFCPLIPGPDFPKLLAKAKREGTIK